MAGHDGNLSTSLTLGLGLLAATMTLITAGSVGLVGFMLGRQIPQQETESFSSQKRNKHEHENATHEQERHHRLRIPSGTASEDVKITDKKAIMDVRISGIRPLIPPAILLEEIPLTTKIVQTINRGRQGLANILRRLDDRLVVVAGCEFLDTMSPQFISDLVSWGAIGARTTECQLHRELCSGLSMPIGFKNGTGGDLQLAVDAVVAAKHSHCFLSVSSQGLAAIVNTSGNDTCHLILRGGKSGPNFEKEHVDDASARMLKANLVDNVMIDCSHGNSQKKHKNQVKVAANIADQLRTGDDRIVGVMLESNIEEGNQPLTPGKPLVYGKSVTDACMGWETTVEVLRDLAAAVRERRAKNHQ
ncbi:hypothetical protein JG687_00011659 [Phytophthora cactorum]|uniref:3-deoxy-D-arabino-heptulosonate 7-phosphate synthase n=1 Tax=Phytophthora cactorum TaxID=29920 RepID=A0A8T1U3Z0_9STRA|nr:hypothetical protein JG687_00011659 [Phytophthora cactorum]